MCTNYWPTSRDRIREFLGVDAPAFDYPAESYPGYPAPIVRLGEEGRLECVAANFGLIPTWAKERSLSRHTYNARSETVSEKPSFRNAWRKQQFCLVPMESFFEPCYESGKAVRWRIERADGLPFAVAGIWERWIDPASGELVVSFSMLTVNADGHPVMGRMHRPEDEKRSIVPLSRDGLDGWLKASPQAATAFLVAPDPGKFVAVADPKPTISRARKTT